MEIERKFLIKEKEKKYPCPFPLENLKKDIKDKGEKIVQNYLPKEIVKDIFKELGFKLRFTPSQLRTRKKGKKYFIGIKSKGNIKREEFEKRISKEVYEILSQLKETSIEKIRLKKRYKNKIIEFDYYPKFALITAEIEFKSLGDAKKFKTNMKEVTYIKKYGNRYLAQSAQD